MLADDTLEQILQQRRDNSAVVVDEAYIEFADRPSVVGLLARYDNLIVLRTLSKAMAYAGARCGCVIGPADVIAMLNVVQAPYALATPVVECVENALDAEGDSEAENRVRQVVAERERLIDALARYSFVRRVWPSAANFLLVEVDDAAALMQQSGDDKLLLRYFGGILPGCVRITVGLPTENDLLLKTFMKVESA